MPVSGQETGPTSYPGIKNSATGNTAADKWTPGDEWIAQWRSGAEETFLTSAASKSSYSRNIPFSTPTAPAREPPRTHADVDSSELIDI